MTVSQQIDDFIEEEGGGRVRDALNVALTRLQLCENRLAREAKEVLAVMPNPHTLLSIYRVWKVQNPDEDYQCDEIHEFMARFSRGEISSFLDWVDAEFR